MRPLNASIRSIPLPARLRSRPVSDTGYPIPRFVAWPDGVADFRIADHDKLARAVRLDLCWLCGQTLGRFKCFVIGPMCAVNRTSSEPPCHRDCAEYAVRACPFLTRPRMRRNDQGLSDYETPGGEMIARNPGVALIWITHDYRVIRDGSKALFKIGEPVEIAAYAQGRTATRDELDASITSGLPLLANLAGREGPEAMAALASAVARADKLFARLLPREVAA